MIPLALSSPAHFLVLADLTSSYVCSWICVASSLCEQCAGSCTNGKLAAHVDRIMHNQCDTCHAGFRIDTAHHVCSRCPPGQFTTANNAATVCTPYTGACAHGKLIDPAKRTHNDHCGSCHSGHHISTLSLPSGIRATRCVPWAGVCLHGTRAKLKLRKQDGHCAACDPGYYLGHRICVPHGGHCVGGNLLPQRDRTHDDQYVRAALLMLELMGS